MKYLLAVFAATAAFIPLSGAAKELPRRQDVLSIMRKACDYEFTEGLKNDWVYSTYFAGLMAAYRATGNKKYRGQALDWASSHDWGPKGRITTTNADRQCCLQTYLELFLLDPDESNEFMIEKAKQNLGKLADTDKPGREIWSWCDALFMAPPALVQLSRATKDNKYIDAMDRLFWDAHEYLYDTKEHLYFRDDGYFYPEKQTINGKKIFWSRGNGWVIAALSRILHYMPGNYPSRAKYESIFKEMAEALRKVQGGDGLWRTSLADSAEFPKPETSGSALFTFAMAWGINKNILDKEIYLPAVVKAWQGLARMTDDGGAIRWVQKIGEAPGDVDKEHSAPFATGALLLAGEEMLKLIVNMKIDMPKKVEETE